MLTHRNFLSNLLALSEMLRSYETDRFVSVLPLHHALEFTGGLLMPLFSGALVTYSQTLKSITGGRGSFTMSLDHYEEVPAQIQQKLIAEAAKAKEAEG